MSFVAGDRVRILQCGNPRWIGRFATVTAEAHVTPVSFDYVVDIRIDGLPGEHEWRELSLEPASLPWAQCVWRPTTRSPADNLMQFARREYQARRV